MSARAAGFRIDHAKRTARMVARNFGCSTARACAASSLRTAGELRREARDNRTADGRPLTEYGRACRVRWARNDINNARWWSGHAAAMPWEGLPYPSPAAAGWRLEVLP